MLSKTGIRVKGKSARIGNNAFPLSPRFPAFSNIAMSFRLCSHPRIGIMAKGRALFESMPVQIEECRLPWLVP